MPGLEGMSLEMWSLILLRGGIALMVAAVVLGIVFFLVLHISKKHLYIRLEEEFGKKRN